MKEEEHLQNLIPGLPDEVALDCLIRIPYSSHHSLKSVCRRWNSLLCQPSFYSLRKMAQKGEDFVCLVQAIVTPEVASQPSDEEARPHRLSNKTPPVYGLTIYNATNNTWQRMPPCPLLPAGIPMFCQCVAVAGKLVLVGGWDPSTLDSVADVYVYDFIHGGGWRRGAPISAARSFFACAAVGSTVYVAGGHDNQKNALRSAELYDPETDTWRAIQQLSEERDECQGFSTVDGRFCVVSGYGTENQGRFDSAGECFDPVSGKWIKFDGVWPFPNQSPRGSTCLPMGEKSKSPKQGPGGITEIAFPHLWFVDAYRGVKEYDAVEKSWKVVVSMPESISSSPCVALINGGSSLDCIDRIFVIGCGSPSNGADVRHRACVLETGNRKWADVEIPPEFSGFIYSATSLHL